MMKMKKLLTLLLAVLMISTLIPAGTSAATFTDTSDEVIETIAALGLMSGYDDGTFLPENTLTRGEFAQIIANIYESGGNDTQAWKDVFFRDESEELELVEEFKETQSSIYSDVETGHWAYSAVMTVHSLGLMNGIGNGEFAPDSLITLDQVYKVMTSLLGYNVKAVVYGGWPLGYRSVARELGLSDGVDGTVSNLTRGTVARILYNAFDVELLQLTGVGDSQKYEPIAGQTFLTKILGYSYYEGQMTDNGVSTLDGVSSSLKDNIKVGGYIFNLGEGNDYIRNFIGREIRLYHTYEKNDTLHTAVFAQLKGRDTVVTFEAKDFVSFKNNTFTYRDESGKAKTVNVVSGAKLIFNGTGEATYYESTFDNITKGVISVIKPFGQSVANLIVAESYRSFYVDMVDTANKKIYSAGMNNQSISIDLSDEEKAIAVYGADGTVSDFSAIAVGSILSVAEGDSVINVYISGNPAVSGFKVDSITEDDGIVTIGSGDKKYVISEEYITLKGRSSISAGKTYTLYIDKFGEVINLKQGAADGLETVLYIANATDGVFTTDVMIKYFSESGKISTAYLASSVTMLCENDSEIRAKDDYTNILTNLNAYEGLMRIRKNADGDISYIELATTQKDSGNMENRLARIRLFDGGTAAQYKKPTRNYYYKIHVGAVGKALMSDARTTFFQFEGRNSDGTYKNIRDVADDKFKISNISGVYKGANDREPNKDTGDIIAYTTVADSAWAEYVLDYSKTIGSDLDKDSKNFYMVAGLPYQTVDLDGEPVTAFDVYDTAGKLSTLNYEEGNLIIEDVRDSATHPVSGEAYKIEPGDIIRYAMSNGIVTEIELIFDENETNPVSQGQGNLAGSLGYSDGATANANRWNPWGVTATGNWATNTVLPYGGGERRVLLAYPYRYRDGALLMTTIDLTKFEFADQSSLIGTNYTYESSNMNSNITVFNIEGDKVTPITSSVKTYETAGHDCDRVFKAERLGNNEVKFVIRGYTGR